jgi:enoyl-CoA hydratase/carnithine racemase
MNYKLIEVQTEGEVGVLRLSQPNKLNAANAQMIEELSDAVDSMAKSVRALLLSVDGLEGITAFNAKREALFVGR